MVLALGDQPTIRLPRVPGPGTLRRGPAAASRSVAQAAPATTPIVRPAPSMTGPLLRALLPSLVAAALAGIVLRGAAGLVVGVLLPTVAVAVAMWKLCRVADRGY